MKEKNRGGSQVTQVKVPYLTSIGEAINCASEYSVKYCVPETDVRGVSQILEPLIKRSLDRRT